MFPRNEHLKVTMYATSVLGTWPIIFEDNPKLKKIYDIYSYCTFHYYLLFLITAMIQLCIIMSDEILDPSEIVANLGVTLLNSVTILRVRVIKTDRVKKLIRKVISEERKILNSGDEKIIKLYKSYAKQSQTYNAIFLFSCFLVVILYIIHPMYVEDSIKFYPKRNETVVTKALPLSTWFPFDEQKFYVLTYVWQELDVMMASTFISSSDTLAFSLIIFSMGQIRILKLILSDFQKYSLKVKHQLNCDLEEASFITLRECILKHKEIIEYIYEYNVAMRNIMVLDFLQSSLQLASIVLSLLMTEVTLFNFIYSGQFALSMFIRLLMYYWFANEVTEHSSEIGIALCSSKWYKEPQRVQKLMIIMLLRCNRNLCLEIGPFSVMTLKTFLGILKATYSYMTVMYK